MCIAGRCSETLRVKDLLGKAQGYTAKRRGNFVERADLVVPLNEGPAWWVVWGLGVRSFRLPD
jgi:hypothetical protein